MRKFSQKVRAQAFRCRMSHIKDIASEASGKLGAQLKDKIRILNSDEHTQLERLKA